MTRFATAMLICLLGVAVFVSGPGAQGTLGGVWTGGGYACAPERPRRMALTIRENAGGALTAEVSIETAPGSGQRVNYAMTGTLDAATGRFMLRSAKPELQLHGQLNRRTETIEGDGDPGCRFGSNFKEPLSAAAPAAPAPPTVAPPLSPRPTPGDRDCPQAAGLLAQL